MTALRLEIKKALTPQVVAAGYDPVQISECERQAISDVVEAADELVSQRGS